MRTIEKIGQEWATIQENIDSGKLSQRQIESAKKQQIKLHNEAERIRAVYGYSGGADGSQVIKIKDDPTTEKDETGRFSGMFQDLTGVYFDRQVKVLEENAFVNELGDVELYDPRNAENLKLQDIKDSMSQMVNGATSVITNNDNSGILNFALFAIVGLVVFKLIVGVFK